MTDPNRRRLFFEPGRLLAEIQDWQNQVEGSIQQIEDAAREPVVTLTRPAMACLFQIQFGLLETNRQVALDAFDTIDDLEYMMTVYREESDLSRANAAAFPGPAYVVSELYELLERCRDLSLTTQGAFDITSGPLVRIWGFRRRQGRLPDSREIAEAMERVGIRKVRFDPADQSVRFERPGMELNLGAIGKGYALDRVAPRFREGGFTGVLLSAGNSSILAVERPTWDDTWRVDVVHPLDSQRVLGRVRLRNQGMSTSGIAEQFFVEGDRRYGHILDPRSGWPVQGMLQSTVVAPASALAEALSTAFFVHGIDWSSDFCRRHPGIGAILVPDPGPGRPLQPVKVGEIHFDSLP